MEVMFALADELQFEITAYGLRVAIVLLVGLLAYRWLRSTLSRLEGDAKDEEDASGLIHRSTVSLLKITFLIVFGAFVFSELGFATGPIVASLSILGLAVAFGAQYAVSDIISGFFTLRENLCRVGDDVTVNNRRGTVREMRLRTLTLRTDTGSLLHSPYGSIKSIEVHK